MKLRWAGLSVGCQWLLYVQAKLRSIDSFQNWTCEDHITKLVTWVRSAQVHNALLTLVVETPLIRIFAILMKVT